MARSRFAPLFAAATAAALLAAPAAAAVTRARCDLVPTGNNADPSLAGSAIFSLDKVGINVQVSISGLSPGDHGWHVHTRGDIINGADALATAGHFIGDCDECRDQAAAQEVGNLDDGTPLVADAGGNVDFSYTDDVITFEGDNSIIGRSLVIHGIEGNSSPRVAQCVIGIEDENGARSDPVPAITEATCLLEETDNNPTSLTGSFTFTQMASGIKVSYFVSGLAPGGHGAHVHEFGDISSTDATATGGHFIGDCDNCRPEAALQEVGYINDGAPIVADANGIAMGTFTDTVITFDGDNSIVGRSIVLHGDGVDSGPRVAQCVIGLRQEAADGAVAAVGDADEYQVLRALAVLEPTANDDGDIAGYVEFDGVPGSDNVEVRFFITGLAPGAHGWHVHTYGDIATDDGLSVGGHFIGDCVDCRTGDALDEVGNIDNGTPIVADDDGVARGTIIDSEIRLNGWNSVVGRGVIIHGDGVEAGPRVAQGAIGRVLEGVDSEAAGSMFPLPSRASCRLEAIDGSGVSGGIWFAEAADDMLTINWDISGLTADETHGWHVHTYGDVRNSDDGLGVGGHFIGSAPARESGPAEVGAIGNNEGIAADAQGVSAGSINDEFAKLRGPDSIVGRAMIIHAPVTGARIAQCVIGVDEPVRVLDSLQVKEAVCSFEATTNNAGPVTGFMRFEQPTLDSLVTVSYQIDGLSDGDHGFHVHTRGDIIRDDGLSVTGHFIGDCDDCRDGEGSLQEVGWLEEYHTMTSAAGVATGSFTDDIISLYGVNSIVGRAIIIHGIEGNTSPRAAQCVIGRAAPEGDDPLDVTLNAPDMPAVTEATCRLEETSLSEGNVDGLFSFVKTDAGLQISYMISGLSPGDHGAHVHHYGDITESDAQATGGHFIGDCADCRPDGVLQEAGYMGDGWNFWANANGVATGVFTDTVLTLNGIHGIVGRSIVVHGTEASAGARVAQCVIGQRQAMSDGAPVVVGDDAEVPQVTSAVAVLESTSNQAGIDGIVEFELVPGSENVEVRFFIAGLAPGAHGWHVHMWGDIETDDGLSVGGHFIGDCANCRTGEALDEVGNLDNGTPIVADANGLARGTIIDTEIRLNGINSIVGRGFIIHGDGVEAGPRVAQAAIGRVGESFDTLVPESPDTSNMAVCRLEEVNDSGVAGNIAFAINNVGQLDISWDITGLTAGATHGWHVHTYGDVRNEYNGLGVGGHFVGSAPDRGSAPAEVGAIGDNEGIVADAQGASVGVITDMYAELRGSDSIVGRAMIIHAPDGPRIAQCVIGRDQAMYDEVELLVTEARCDFEATSNNAEPVTGSMVFSQTDAHGPITAVYSLGGLSPGLHSFHVHLYGDMIREDGISVGGHFIGPNPVRPDGVIAEVGWLGDAHMIVAAGDGEASGEFSDTEASLNGINSIVGRSLIIHGIEGDSSPRAAQCVIGRTAESTTPTAPPRPTVTEATCRLEASDPTGDRIDGTVDFVQYGDSVKVSYMISGVGAGDHAIHVHEYGDISSTDASATGGHFIGNCVGCRPDGVLQEVGYLNDGAAVTAGSNGVAIGSFVDSVAKLNGENSIVGRSIVLHDGNNGNERVAHCVIGLRQDAFLGAPTPMNVEVVPQVTSAVVHLHPTANGDADIEGMIEFHLVPESDAVEVRFFIVGLAPGAHGWHVHVWGDDATDDGLSVGGHFIGDCADCRTGDALDEVGNLDNGTPIVADANGLARGVIVDTEIRLNGFNSIVGRGFIIHGDGVEAGPRVAQGVIGRNTDAMTALSAPHGVAAQAVCTVRPVGSNTASGQIKFYALDQGVRVTYDISGLTEGMHGWHVHTYGDLRNEYSGLGVAGHFLGSEPDRGEGLPAEVGAIGDNMPIEANADGRATGSIDDKYATLNGPDGILGRGMIIHGDGVTPTARVGQCAIGVDEPDAEPPVTGIVVDDGGASVSTPGNAASVVLPESAVEEPVLITIEEVADVPNLDEPERDGVAQTLVSEAFNFGPSGTQFEQDVTVCVEVGEIPDYDSDGTVCLCFIDEARDGPPEWECLDECLYDDDSKQACGSTDHFTVYAAFYAPPPTDPEPSPADDDDWGASTTIAVGVVCALSVVMVIAGLIIWKRKIAGGNNDREMSSLGA